MPRVTKLLGAVAAIAGAWTLLLAFRTYWYLFHSITNVPFSDLWAILEEIQNHRSGLIGWSYLWQPYWGQRMLLPRLIFLFSVRYLHFSTLPLVLINAGAQLAMLGVLIAAARGWFREARIWFWLAAVAVTHLVLSSMQLEVLIEGIEVQYTIGFASAVAAICILRDQRRFWTACALAMVSTLCLAVGPLTWPILAFECWAAGRKRRAMGLAVTTALVAAIYSVGYSRPAIGMGLGGVLRSPWQAFTISGLVLGGPISLYTRPLGSAAGCLGMVFLLPVLAAAWRKRAERPAGLALALVACFMCGSAAAIAFGRLSPEWLAQNHGLPLPSRYLVPGYVFWAALFTAALAFRRGAAAARAALAGTCVVVLVLTCAFWRVEWRMPREWAQVAQGMDAIGSGFFLPVSDHEFMSRVFSNEELRTRMVEYMRQQKLALFDEPRATWLGKDAASVVKAGPRHDVEATFRMRQPLDDPSVYRLVGSLTVDGRRPRQRLDVLFVDNQGRITGLARTLPAQSETLAAADFFGYARGTPTRLILLNGAGTAIPPQ